MIGLQPRRLHRLCSPRVCKVPRPNASRLQLTILPDIQSFERGDVKQGPRTSSVTAAEPCASPHHFVADANSTRLSTDVRVTDTHPSAKVLAALPPPLPVEPRTEPAPAESTKQHPVLSTNSDSLSKYKYLELSPGDIRLLHLMPHEEEGAPIRCELFDYPIQKTGGRACLYEALSYCWGGSDKPYSISIGDRYLPVTANLHAALLQLRDRFLSRVLWVDAICINQDDKEERGQQVRSMAEIYCKASRVIVWLGKAETDNDDTLAAIALAGQKSTEPVSDKTSQEAVLALLKRPWFRRIWVSYIICPALTIEGN